RRAPQSTLFPYTTLFRSVVLGEQQGRVGADGLAQVVLGAAIRRRAQFGVGAAEEDQRVVGRDLGGGVVLVDRRCELPLLHQVLGDRKSTRLNSSHLGISY